MFKNKVGLLIAVIALAVIGAWAMILMLPDNGKKNSANDGMPLKADGSSKASGRILTTTQADGQGVIPKSAQDQKLSSVMKHPQDFHTARKVLVDSRHDDTIRNEAANLLCATDDPKAIYSLVEVIKDSKEGPRFKSFAVQHLYIQGEKSNGAEVSKIQDTLNKALESKHVAVRREALLALVRRKDPNALKTAVLWLNSDDQEADSVRDLAIRCVQESDLREHIPIVRKYLRAHNKVIRIAAIVALSQWKDEASRSAFEEAANSKIVRIQRAGKAALKQLKIKGNSIPKSSTESFKF